MPDAVAQAQELGPASTMGFGPRESADETRQSQHQAANDVPVDVNPNAIMARAQSETITLMGKNFEANAMRFNGVLSAMMSRLAGEAPQPMVMPKTAP